MPSKSAKPRGNVKPTRSSTPPQPSPLHKEVKHIITAGVGVLLMFAVLLNDTLGMAGVFANAVMRGFFGYGAFILPLGIMAFAIVKLVARNFKLPIVKIIAVFWLVLSLLHIFLFEPRPDSFIFVDVFNAGLDSGGGIMGLIIGGLASFFLNVAAPFVIIAAIILLLVLISKRSLIDSLKNSWRLFRRGDVDDDDYHFHDYVDKPEPAKVIDMPARGRGKKIVHRGRVRPKKKSSNIIEIEPRERQPEDFDEKIMLVSESINELHVEQKNRNPLFAKRKSQPEPKNRAEVIAFPDTHFDEAQIRILPKPKPAPIEDDEPLVAALFDEQDFEKEDLHDSRMGGGALYGEPSVMSSVPASASEVDGSEPIVKGMIADAVLEDEGMSGLLLYDEFANSDDTIPVATSGVNLWGTSAYTAPSPTVTETAETAETTVASEDSNTATSTEATYENYQLPSINLLAKNERPAISAESRTQVLENSRLLEETLRSFRIEAKVVEVSVGPTVTRYDLSPGPGVKVNSIANLSNDLALSLAAQGLRIEAPVPGKSAVGIEVPNKDPQGVFLREILEDERFENFPSKLAFAVGKDIAGSPIITDVARMPHLLIAGATGSGKSVCINTLIASLLYKARPDEVKLLMIDPKVVELSVYNGIPHLLIPVVTDPKKASGALSWAVTEMENRYNSFAETGCRDLQGFNKHAAENNETQLPQIVIIIDELADLMMTCKGDVEDSICRLAQKARAAGIHLIVATQRPSVDVITGLIKANIPSRLAFAVSSGTDSRTVLDMYGAEKLLGKGDMLFLPMGQNKPIRVQGGYISDKEVETLVNFLKAQAPTVHSIEDIQRVTMPGKAVVDGEVDEFFHDAVEFLLAKGKGSTSMMQRQFRIGYNRASRLMDDLHARGIVGPEDGVKPRKVTITREEYKEIYGENN
ncbi:MAG: DNA translocase FtsK [Defluviitaleaceae bacterium]|nr:DNA translocase FtsK [Defluviitaleaceae bacterium]